MPLFSELIHRKRFRAGIAHLAAAWLQTRALELIDIKYRKST